MNQAGTLITKSETGSLSSAEAVALTLLRNMDTSWVAVNFSFLPKYVTSAPAWPLISTREADTNSCSIWTSGSFKARPANRFKDPTVFFRLEISWVFADSPRYRDLGPKPTRDLPVVLEVNGRRKNVLQDSRCCSVRNFVCDLWKVSTSTCHKIRKDRDVRHRHRGYEPLQ